MIKYIRLPIVDDGSVDIMLEIPSIHPSISNVELYLEVESIFIEPVEQESQPTGFVPFDPFSPSSSEPTMERQVSVIGNIFGLSNYGTNSQYDRDASVNLIAVEQLVYSEPSNIFGEMNVNNGLLEEENEKHEKEDDFEKINLETDSTTLKVPFHDPNIPFFTNIDRVDDTITSN